MMGEIDWMAMWLKEETSFDYSCQLFFTQSIALITTGSRTSTVPGLTARLL